MSYLIDTSAWVGFFRHRDSPANQALKRLLGRGPDQVLGCPPVRMELATDPHDLRRRRVLRVYDSFVSADITADDFDLAAAIYRATRLRGHTVRSQFDCVIAAISIRRGAILVHDDVDFDRMAEAVDSLSVHRLPGG